MRLEKPRRVFFPGYAFGYCKFRNGAWRPRAAFQDRVLSFEDRIIYNRYNQGGRLCRLERG